MKVVTHLWKKIKQMSRPFVGQVYGKQPLLVKYFEYEELKILKEIVLKEHELVKERQSQEKAQEEEPETNRNVKVLRDLNLDLCSLWDPCEAEGQCHKLEDGFRDDCLSKQCYDQVCASPTLEIPPQQGDYPPDLEPVTALSVPTEILLEIFSYLSPAELGQCAQVCWAWNNAAFSPPLWKAIYPVQWARGIWKWHDVGLTHALEDAASGKVSRYLEKWDEDADIDEAEEERDPQADKECFVMESLVKWVLPRVGAAVSTLVLDTGRGITSRLLHNALLLCPAIVNLSAAHTQIDYYSFKGLWFQGSLQCLKNLDLQGCELIDDSALECLAQCAYPAHCPMVKGSLYCPYDINPLAYNVGLRNEVFASPFETEVCRQCGAMGGCFCPGRRNVPNGIFSGDLPLQGLAGGGKSIYNNSKNVKKSNNTQKKARKKNSMPFPQETVQGNGISNTGLRANEQDIEEICCYMGNYSSPPGLQGNLSCRRPEYETRSVNTCNFMQQSFYDPRYEKFDNGVRKIQLTSLNLSGCWRVTDEGLLALLDSGMVVDISHLDVSGCFQLTGEGLEIFTETCPSLQPEKLSYCDNITDGPYPNLANGCANLCNPLRVCCRNGR
ncbi:F-box/LRR-repeat protein 5-like [Penaeus indicus]|uniref:F-box/LRR-repeat protein 5-like n=1 Tax=Penaeus indicus TaxID=29960 RepID=UPI00300D47B1